MLDLNRLFLFLALLSPIVVLLQTARRAAANRGWQLAALIVLAVTGASWLVIPNQAGYVGGSAWFFLLLLPAIGLRREADLVAAERYGAARRLVSILRWLHPVEVLREEETFLRAMEAAQQGEAQRAADLLRKVRGKHQRAGLQTIAQNFRIQGDWPGLIAWCRTQLPAVALGQEPVVLPLYFRALGETGALSDLVLQVAGRAPRLLASPQHQATFDASVLVLFAFTGRVETVARLLKTRFPRMPEETKEFWVGTSELAAGQTEGGRARLARVHATTRDALLRADIARRLQSGRDARARLEPLLETTVRRFEKDLGKRRRFILAPAGGLPGAAVMILMALNGIMFLLELRLGGSMNNLVLHRLGALEPLAVLANGQYWRMLSSLFLHYGALHLVVNSYALYVLGPPLEEALGSLRFAVVYLLAGLGSSAGVVLLWHFEWTQADLLVGASGAIMGIVGAWGGLLLRHHRVPTARRWLVIMGTIALIQTAFDFFTPQISMAAHLCGLVAGFGIGLGMAREREDSASYS